MRGMHGRLVVGALLAPALACQAPPPVIDAGCLDAGINTVCGGPDVFPVRFAGLIFPLLGDGGVLDGGAAGPVAIEPNVLEIILADHDLSATCNSGDPTKLVAFTGVEIWVNGYFLAVDAGTYTAPTSSIYEITFVPDAGTAGPTELAASDDASVLLTSVNAMTSAAGYFSGEMALPETGLVQLNGNFTAQACQGLGTALCLETAGAGCSQ
jgi:hypothetical protein